MARAIPLTTQPMVQMKAIRIWTVRMALYVFVRFFVLLADVLPRRGALGFANGLAWVELFCTKRGRSAVSEARLIFGLEGLEAWKFSHQWLGIPYKDLVMFRRAARGRERPEEWSLEQVNGEAVNALVDAGKPILVAGGHFEYSSMLALAGLHPELDAGVVMNPIEPFKFDGAILLRRLINGTMRDLSVRLRPKSSIERLHVGQTDVQTRLLEVLSRPNGIGMIMVDAWWSKPNAYRRPFAGKRRQPLALGAARISRLAQCPVVVIAAERTGRKTVRLHYSDLIYPGPEDSAEGDRAMLDQMIDRLEVYVGRFRGQFAGFVGWERRWDSSTEHWIPLDEPHDGAECRNTCFKSSRRTGD